MARFFRPDFDPRREFVVAREFTFDSARFLVGQGIDKKSFTPRRLRQLYNTRYLEFGTAVVRAPQIKPKVQRYRSRRLVLAEAG